MSFDASLPVPYAKDLATALGIVNKDGLGAASYEAPGAGAALPFILAKVSLSGGSSLDTVEYPYFGGWSSEALNEKPQVLKVEGALVGSPNLIDRRNALIEAFRRKTSDDAPGYVSLPSWGRFPVVVDTWDVSEELDKQGRYAVSLTVLRAGRSEAARQAASAAASTSIEAGLAALSTASQDAFAAALPEENLSTALMAAGFGAVATRLLTIVGRVQGAQSKLNAMTNSVLGITNLIAQGISAPKELAAALYSSIIAVTSSIIGIGDDAASIFEPTAKTKEGEDRNIVNATTAFLANASFLLDVPVATAKDLVTRTAIQNLYRTASFYATAVILPHIGDASYDKVDSLFALFVALETSIDRTDPELSAACTDLRIIVATELDSLELYRKRFLALPTPVPSLFIAAKLAIPHARLMLLNSGIADEFLVQGEIAYV